MHLYSFVTEQGHILWVMFLLGIGLGLGYDLIRTLRRISKITKEGRLWAIFSIGSLQVLLFGRYKMQKRRGFYVFVNYL